MTQTLPSYTAALTIIFPTFSIGIAIKNEGGHCPPYYKEIVEECKC